MGIAIYIFVGGLIVAGLVIIGIAAVKSVKAANKRMEEFKNKMK